MKFGRTRKYYTSGGNPDPEGHTATSSLLFVDLSSETLGVSI